MRELLFRGQTRRKGEKTMNIKGDPMPSEWAEGGILQGAGCYSIIYGWKGDNPRTGSDIDRHVVYSDTVGQYTGQTDMNGKRIFEGDIVKFKNELFVVDYVTGFASFSLRHPTNMRYAPSITPITVEEMEVIGNCWDNPELLGVTEKGSKE